MSEHQVKEIAGHFKEILKLLKLDLPETPERVARMYVEDLFCGMDSSSFPKVTLFANEGTPHDNQIIVKMETPFVSFCEHHLLPMNGVVKVAYIPGKQLIGLSNIPKIVHHYAKRPQLQERLTHQIADKLAELLDISDVAVRIEATQFCMLARGLESSPHATQTQLCKGYFTQHCPF
jgi:GTP cyclohydrolase I